ncbi:MAG: trigger factor [Oscillospiraceae bacterium]|jgi:trigger factor|nr:trigger factor [Oscillospiraceae bacterium]
MSFVSKEKTEPATWRVSASISAADFGAKVEEIFAKELSSLVVPGFRKGKAPRSLVEKRYGEKVFFDEALDALLPKTVEEAVKEAGLELIFAPEALEVEELSRETGVKLQFTAITAPEVTVGDYKGLEIAAAEAAAVTQEDIDARIRELQQRNARTIEAESRAAQSGDIAQIDFTGFIDGTAFEGGAAENYDLMLGSESFIPGFEEQIIGRQPGEEFDVNVVFPEDYGSEALAGKPVVFQVKLHALKREELPEADDDFAQEVGEDCDTVAELRAGIAKELAESREKESAEGFEAAVQDALTALLRGEIAGRMFEQRAKRNEELFLERIQIPLERYCAIVGGSEEEFRAEMAGRAEKQVKLELALEAVAAAEGFAPDEEEIEAEYARIAAEYKVELARAKYAVPREEIVRDLNRVKALAFVKAQAVRVEPAAQETAAQST